MNRTGRKGFTRMLFAGMGLLGLLVGVTLWLSMFSRTAETVLPAGGQAKQQLEMLRQLNEARDEIESRQAASKPAHENAAEGASE